MSMNENCLCVLVVTKTAKVSVSGVGLGLDPAGLGLGQGRSPLFYHESWQNDICSFRAMTVALTVSFKLISF